MKQLILFLCVCSSFHFLKGQTFFLDENFNSGIDTSVGKWTIVNGGTTGDTWFGTTGGRSGNYLDGTEFALVDSDAAGSGGILLREELVSPIMNTAGAGQLLLEFDHYFNGINSGDYGLVEVYDGTSWVLIDSFSADRGSWGSPAQPIYDITPYSNSNFQLRFVYDDNSAYAWYWAVDNVKIFTPPDTSAGVSAIITPGNSTCGDSSMTLALEVVNSGSQNLVNIPVEAQLSGLVTTTLNGVLPGPLAPGAVDTIILSGTFNASAGGQLNILAYTLQSNDEIVSDDTLSTSVTLFSLLSAPQVTGDTVVCPGESATLSIVDPEPTLSYLWYDSLGGPVVATGNSVTLGSVLASTSFHAVAASVLIGQMGPPDNTFGSGGSYSAFFDGLVFDVISEPMIIDSVDIYPLDAGDVVVDVRDGQGNVVGTTQVAVAPTSPNQKITIPVGITVPTGTDYSISAIGSTVSGLYRNSSSASYPYTLGSYAKITGAINALSSYYYFFYNWSTRIGTICPSPSTSVLVDTFSAAPPTAGFTFVDQTVGTTYTVDFSDASSGPITSWHWDFGNGDTSSVQNPSYVYQNPGNYTVTLTVVGQCGDSSVTSQTIMLIGIEDALGAALSVYPNPSSGKFHVSLGNIQVESAELKIMTMQGQQIWVKELEGIGQLDEVLEPKLSPGTYFLYVDADGKRAVRKLLIRQ